MSVFPLRVAWACAVMFAATLPAMGAPDARDRCPAAHMAPLVLPRVKQALEHNSELTIVALGSSSTQGWHSSTIAQSYPAVLQAALSAALPRAHVAIINRGIGGQDAAEMVPRIEADVLEVRPTLVIWQVGANGVLKNRDPEAFRNNVTAGVQMMRDAGIDLVLMDNQRAPAILAAPHHLQIDQALIDVSLKTGTNLFDRGALMDQWQLAGAPYDRFISDDGVHHNDLGYRCVALALASAIVDGLTQPAPPVRSASVVR